MGIDFVFGVDVLLSINFDDNDGRTGGLAFFFFFQRGVSFSLLCFFFIALYNVAFFWNP